MSEMSFDRVNLEGACDERCAWTRRMVGREGGAAHEVRGDVRSSADPHNVSK